jgi:1-phosphofructokinase family hexose kinase
MFFCVSPNPAIDKRLRVSKLTLGKVNRAEDVRLAPGGKAAHVAMVLKALQTDPLWVGFTGGANGEALLGGLHELGIRAMPVPIEQSIRNNLEIIEADGTVTEILEPGPALLAADAERFQNKCEELFANDKKPAYAILSGSLPPGLQDGFYANLIRSAHHYGCKVFLDTSRRPLQLALEEGPDFVKPNREEAEWLIGSRIHDLPTAVSAVHSLLGMGAKSAAISLGADGLVWCPRQGDTVFHAKPPVVEMRSAVGSGDAVVAAFAYSISLGLEAEESIRLATACGTANCMAELPGQLKIDDVSRLRNEIRVSRISSD